MLKSALIILILLFMYFIIHVLQMRMSVRLETLVLMPVTTPWAPTIVPAPEASQSQLMAGPVRVHTHNIMHPDEI